MSSIINNTIKAFQEDIVELDKEFSRIPINDIHAKEKKRHAIAYANKQIAAFRKVRA